MAPVKRARIQLPCVVQEQPHTCGAAALLAICRYYGVGPRDEATIARDMGMLPDGSDPLHLRRAARRYGLAYAETRGMTDAQLRAQLTAGHPVILAVQAWGEGHWVVAIDHDARGIVVEDPWLADARGRIGWRALANRWHDIEGAPPRPLVRYGLAVWATSRAGRAQRGAPRNERVVKKTR